MPAHGSRSGRAGRGGLPGPCAWAGRPLSCGHPRQPSPAVHLPERRRRHTESRGPMRIGVPMETASRERRVALVPDSVARLRRAGLEVVVERGAGLGAGFADAAYQKAGAALAGAAEALAAGLVLKVRRPGPEEVDRLSPGAALACLLQPAASPDLLQRLAARKVTALAMELVPRITRAQSMDALSSQATVAGYKAVILGASHLWKLMPMLTTAAGTLAPVGRVLPDQDLVIATAQVPGRPAPRLVAEETVRAMRPGSVVVDLAAESGGNCALTRPGEMVEAGGVTIMGPLDLAATLPYHASQMYSRNLESLASHLWRDGALRLDLQDEITRAMAAVYGGEVRWRAP